MPSLRRASMIVGALSVVAGCASAPVREVVFHTDVDPDTGDARSLVMIREGSAELRWQCGPEGIDLFFYWGTYVNAEHSGRGNTVSASFEFTPAPLVDPDARTLMSGLPPQQSWPRGSSLQLSKDRRGGFFHRSTISAFTKAALSSERVTLRVSRIYNEGGGLNPFYYTGDVVSTRELTLTGLSTELVKLACYQGQDADVPTSPIPAPPSGTQAPDQLSGLWKGTMRRGPDDPVGAFSCEFLLSQTGSSVSGAYYCQSQRESNEGRPAHWQTLAGTLIGSTFKWRFGDITTVYEEAEFTVVGNSMSGQGRFQNNTGPSGRITIRDYELTRWQ